MRRALPWAAVATAWIPFALGVRALRAACAGFTANEDADATARRYACEAYAEWPNAALNLLFFAGYCVPLWIHGLVSRSTWLVDPYWTLMPLSIHAFYATRPGAVFWSGRGLVATALLYAWSGRLSRNYWRREAWEAGAREDWRLADLRRELGWFWGVASLFVAYVSQQGMLVGLCLPFHEVFRADAAPLNALDLVAVAVCVGGLEVARRSDDALYAFRETAAPGAILDAGLWRLCRHPNHLGEQVWWLGVALLAVSSAGRPTPYAFGWILNHACDAAVTVPLIDRRLGMRADRVRAWLDYAATTPQLLPTAASYAACRKAHAA